MSDQYPGQNDPQQPQQPYGDPAQAQYDYQQQGYPQQDPYAKSRIVAGLLGIFLGPWGVHRFYLGYAGIGVVQIVVTIVTFGIGGLWGIIEGILILVAKPGDTFYVDASGRPLRS